jgi:hypothetical protein
MKEKFLIITLCVIFSAYSLSFAGDLTVNGKLTAVKTFQAGKANNQDKWVQVIFPVEFDAVPIVVVTPVKVSTTSGHFFVEVRNITTTGFEFRAINHDGTGHGNTTDMVNWIAIVP